ncbi:MAG: PQQ-binding-like beta-propeller repeat protein, partial [Planctomycetota bacterium]
MRGVLNAKSVCRLAFAFTLSLFTVCTVRVAAQSEEGSGVFPANSESYQSLWQRFETLRRESRWNESVETLLEFGELVMKGETNAVISTGGTTSPGAGSLLARLIGQLPKDRAASLQETLDARLEKALQSATETSEAARAKLRARIVRDFPSSRLGLSALKEETDLALLEGEWRRVSDACSAILQLESSGGLELEHGDKFRALLFSIEAYRRLGERPSWDTRRAELEELSRSSPVSSAWSESVRRVLRGEFSADASSLDRSSYRNAFVDASTPSPDEESFLIGGLEWRSASGTSDLRRFVEERSTARDGEEIPWADVQLPYHPGTDGSTVVFRDDRRVVAYDLKGSRERWSYKLDTFGNPRGTIHAPVIAGGRVFVQSRSLDCRDARTGRSLWTRRIALRREPRELVVEEPIPLEIGDESEENDGGSDDTVAPLDGELPADSVSPPAVSPNHAERLFVPVAFADGREALCYLLCISFDGEVQWKTYLGSSRSSNLFGLGSVASPPLIVGNHVICLTNRGLVCSVDARDGQLLWIDKYPTLSPRGLRESIREEDRWHVNPIVPLASSDTGSSGEVLIAPQDSPYLLAIRASDGSTLWRHLRESHSTLLGCRGDLCFLAGRQVSALVVSGPERGKTRWLRQVSAENSRPLGRATLHGNGVLVSTPEALLRLDAFTGKTQRRELWSFRGGGGNHLVVGSRLAVSYPGGFLVYSDLNSERRRVAGRPVQDPRTALETAKFSLRSGEVERALKTLSDWRETNPQIPEPNSELDRLYLEVAQVLRTLARTGREDESAKGSTERLLRERIHLELRPSRKVSAAIELGRYLERENVLDRALDAYHLALRFDSPRTSYAPDGTFDIPSASYIRERLVAIRRRAGDRGPRLFAATEARAQAAFDTAEKREGKNPKSPVSFLEIQHQFPYTNAAALSYRAVAQYYLDYKNYGNAARSLLNYLRDFPNRNDVVDVRIRCAQLLYRSGQRVEAKRLYLTLRDENPDVKVRGIRGIGPGETVGDYAKRRLADPGLSDVEVTEARSLRFPLRKEWRSPADLLAINRTFLSPGGIAPQALKGCFLTQSNEIIECRTVADGLPLWRIHLRMIPGFVLDRFASEFFFARSGDRIIQGRYVENLLVLHDHRNVFAIDAERGNVRWHVPLGQSQNTGVRVPRLSERVRGLLISPKGVFAATSGRRIYAFNLQGEKLWERSTRFNIDRQDLFEGDDELFVFETRKSGSPQRAHGFRFEDGSLSQPLWNQESVKTTRHLSSKPVEVGYRRLLIPYRRAKSSELQFADLSRRRKIWSWSIDHAEIEGVFYDEKTPSEVIVTFNRRNNWPAIVGLSMRDGRELWRYEKFDARLTKITVFRDRDKVFVIHGTEQWKLLGLEISRGAIRGKLHVSELWEPRDVRLGTFFGSSRERRL